jgi:hypothetical protein
MNISNRASRAQEAINVKSRRVPAIDRAVLVRNGSEGKSCRGRPQAKSDEFRQYAEEALRWAHQSKTEKEKEALIDLARTWMQATLESESTFVVNISQLEARAPYRLSSGLELASQTAIKMPGCAAPQSGRALA